MHNSISGIIEGAFIINPLRITLCDGQGCSVEVVEGCSIRQCSKAGVRRLHVFDQNASVVVEYFAGVILQNTVFHIFDVDTRPVFIGKCCIRDNIVVGIGNRHICQINQADTAAAVVDKFRVVQNARTDKFDVDIAIIVKSAAVVADGFIVV